MTVDGIAAPGRRFSAATELAVAAGAWLAAPREGRARLAGAIEACAGRELPGAAVLLAAAIAALNAAPAARPAAEAALRRALAAGGAPRPDTLPLFGRVA